MVVYAAEIRRFFIFPRWRLSAILELLCEWLDHPRRVFGGLYHCAKFGWNRCGSFDNMQVLVFHEFGLKSPIHEPFWGVFGAHFPQEMSLKVLTPKTTVLGRNHVIWAIKREYQSEVRAGHWNEKKDRTRKKSQEGYISPIWGEALTQVIYIKKWLVGDLLDVITYAKFQNEIFSGYHFTGGQSFHFPIDTWMGLTTVQRYCMACYKPKVIV